ncbi:MAG: DUF2284 domain-containing protein [Eubacterium sp.]|nr:DUF2284 domain-containing protein [Eubacterium sp.]
MTIEKYLEENAKELGIHQYGFTTVDKISFSPQVRDLCEKNYCGHYGKSWACPPAVGTYEECMARIKKYDRIMVFTTLHPLEDSFDFEGMMAGQKSHGETADKVFKGVVQHLKGDVLNLSKDGCGICETCSYPDSPCRFPDKLAPAIESYGVEVNRLAAATGVNYINGANTVTYFGCVLFHNQE